MPFMATERWLMRAVQSGGDRQALHEVIRQASLVVAERVGRGEENDLLNRLATAPEFRALPVEELRADLDPVKYIGRAASQVPEFLDGYLAPLVQRASLAAAAAEPGEIFV